MKISSPLSSVFVCLILVACTAPEKTREKASDEKSPSTVEVSNGPAGSVGTDGTSNEGEVDPAPSGGFMPACLNLVENDRRVEFSRSKLIITDNGKPKSLDLDDGDDVRCEKLRVIEKARVPSVEIVYLTRESGTTVNVLERMMGVASIRDGKWLAKPLIIDRLFRTESGVTTTRLKNVKWSEEQGRPVLTRTDLESKESETIKP